MSCPVCGEPLKRGKNVKKTVPFYTCQNPECPVIRVHALKSGRTLEILRVIKDSRFSGDLSKFADLISVR